MTRQVEEFKPLEEGRVNAYVCGLTVYDDMHIGHARTYLAFDIIFRYLKYRGYGLTYIQNVTDVDDKIIKRAAEKGVEPLNLAKEYAERARHDRELLGLLEADEYPKVSNSIEEIVGAVDDLIDSGFAYQANGSVYFDVSSFPEYGKLSNQDTDQLGQHRVEAEPGKKSPLDFALWKSSGDGELGFDSPWGRGRPGWHIECTVMSRHHLGPQFDIHGGALDLVFPHHENEIAQSEALTGRKPFVKYWLHTGFLQSSGEKMSKSLGNILPVRQFLEQHNADSLRLLIAQTHYRSPVDYGTEKVEAAEAALARLINFRRELAHELETAKDDGGEELKVVAEKLRESFMEHMDDDFNTPEAVASIFESVRQANASLGKGTESRKSLQAALSVFDELFRVLGLGLDSQDQALSQDEEAMVRERDEARKSKDWAQADELRQKLLERGIKLTDRKDGTTKAERIQ